MRCEMAEKTKSITIEISGEWVDEFFTTLNRINATIEDTMTQAEYIVTIWTTGQRLVTNEIKEIEKEQAYC